jgi:hypothetical protein
MTASKELAIRMIKELEKVNTNLVGEIEKLNQDINKNDELIKMVMEATGVTDDDLYKEDFVDFKKLNPNIAPISNVKVYAHPPHKYDYDLCEQHHCGGCMYDELYEEEEPCCNCWALSDEDDAPCFYVPKHN